MHPQDYKIGETVEAHPACDCWMMGDRLGRVEKIGRKHVSVRMFVSGKLRRFHPDLLVTR